METLAHWWRHLPDGLGRVDVYLRFNRAGGQYEVEHRLNTTSTWREFATEAEARAVAEALCAGEEWQCLIYLPRGVGRPASAARAR